MARESRRKSESGVYHIMLRGINRQTIFENDEDKIRMLNTMKRFKDISQVEVYSYCLMDNHVHLLVKEQNEPISKFIQRISASYVFWYNIKYERCGHLFQERFKSENIETTPSFLRVLRYIHQNPVKAGLSENVLDCKWTSMNEYVDSPHFVDVERGLQLFSSDQSNALRLFTDYMKISNDDEYLDDKQKVRMPDSEVKSHLHNLGISHSGMMLQLDKKKQKEIILELKRLDGVTVRQLSRITGVSKSVIGRIR